LLAAAAAPHAAFAKFFTIAAAAATYWCQSQLQGLHQQLVKHKLNAASTVAHKLTNTRE
jgi:hypothetical protein